MGKHRKKRRKMGWREQIFFLSLSLTSIVFIPTTILLCIGMLPTVVASFADTSREKMLGLTIGAINLSGCAPFVMELWTSSHDISNSLSIVSNPVNLIIMYTSAAVGYVVEWSVTGVVVVFMTEKARLRLENIDKTQEEMIVKWGAEVTGDIKLGSDGFPIENQEDPA